MADPIVKKRVAAPVAAIVPLSDFNALKGTVQGQQQWISENQLTEQQQDATFNAFKLQIEAFDQTAAGRLELAEQKLAKIEPDINDLKQNVSTVQTNVSGFQNTVSGVQNNILLMNTKLTDHDTSLKNADDNFAALGMTTAPVYATKTFNLPYAEPVSSMEFAGKTAELVDQNGAVVTIKVGDSGVLFGGDLQYTSHPMGGLVLTNQKPGTYHVIVAKFIMG